MEKFSKNKGRGRPRIIEGKARNQMRGLYPHKSERTLLNTFNANRAIGFLRDNDDFAWLLETHKSGNWKRGTLLTEIGRFIYREDIEEVAREICKQKPKVKDGVTAIRRYRLTLADKKPSGEGDPMRLYDELANTLNDFLHRYPETEIDGILSAIQLLEISAKEDLE